jgi:histone H3/H4
MSFWQSDLNFQAKAIEALQHATEDYLVHLFEDVSLFGALLAYCVRLL